MLFSSCCKAESSAVLEANANNATLQAIMQTSPTAIVIIDQNSYIIEWSDKAEAMFGYTRVEIIGKLITETIVPAQHAKGHMQGVRRYMNTRQSHLIGKNHVMLTALHRDGHVFPIS